MPSSYVDQITDIMNLIIFSHPKSILDVGIGFGKYAFLSREYLDAMGEGHTYHQRKLRIEGIEGFADYITPLHRAIYDEIHVGDAREILPKLSSRYDLLIMIDVLEHFTYEDGKKVLQECQNHARNVLISTPKWMDPQGAAFGNDFETHRFQWNRSHLKDKPNAFFIPNSNSYICFWGEDAGAVRRAFRKYLFNSRIKRWMPAAVPLLRRISRSKG